VNRAGETILLANPKKQNRQKPFYAIFPNKNNNHIFYDYSEIVKR
jgi:hypothetical protein